MKATVEDLRKGDVVLISTGSTLFEAKLLREPRKVIRGKKTTWRGIDKWTSVVCAVREETFTYQYQGNNRTYNYTRPVICNGDYNKEKRINFTGRDCWILKREI